MIHKIAVRHIELRCQPPLRDGHSHCIGEALAQRPRGGFHARRFTVLGMARGSGAELTELPDVLDGYGVSEKMQQRILQHGTMSGRKDEPVPNDPEGIRGTALQKSAP